MDECDEETPHAEWRWHNDWMLEWVADDATLAMQDDETICVGIDKGNDSVMVPLVCIDALLVRRGLPTLAARNAGAKAAPAPQPAPIGCCVCGATMLVGETLTKTARGMAHADHFQNPEPVR